MRYQFVIYEKKGHIAYVTINRPEVMNALHYDTNAELSEAFDDFKQDDESWVAILTGAGTGRSPQATISKRPLRQSLRGRSCQISANVFDLAGLRAASCATNPSLRR